MTIWGCYLVAMLPLIASALLWFFCKKIVWFEAAILAVSGFIISTIFYFCVVHSMYSDIETWSGQVTSACHTPPWLEYYEEAVYRTEYYEEEETEYETDSEGHTHSHTVTVTKSREVFDHWEPEQRWHQDTWDATDTLIGNYYVDQTRFEDIAKKFGAIVPEPGQRTTFEHNSRMISGDPNDYVTQNVNQWIYPVTTSKHWENRVKACPSVFSYKPVAPEIKVFNYPENSDHFSSSRLCGPVGMSLEKWDQMNAYLGPQKHVNVIVCAFGPESGMDMGEFQEAKWIGGKKNDIIITYGGGTNDAKPSWCHVFGWSESDIVKLDIQTIILNNGINDDIIPLIQAEIFKNYKIKDWHKFDYLKAEIPFNRYIWLILITLGVGGGWITFSLCNNLDKNRKEDSFSYDGLRKN